ncbi:hypothetical protein ACTID9_13730 [Brevibacillus fluminis]|uniref:hypothetical protein n=1 Tax=Brevibacillus fluminis TaxID=511487 RepID=UPI003F8B8181
MTLRRLPIMLSFLVTMVLLFGGWYLYQQMEVKEPLKTEVQQMTSATLTDLKVAKDQVIVKLHVTNPDTFPQEYRQLQKELQAYSNGREIDVEVTNQGEQLKKIWTDGQFAVNEAIELHEYSKIPQLVAAWKQTYKLDSAVAKMDDSTIYIYMKNGQQDFYAMLPRTATTGEVTLHV